MVRDVEGTALSVDGAVELRVCLDAQSFKTRRPVFPNLQTHQSTSAHLTSMETSSGGANRNPEIRPV